MIKLFYVIFSLKLLNPSNLLKGTLNVTFNSPFHIRATQNI